MTTRGDGSTATSTMLTVVAKEEGRLSRTRPFQPGYVRLDPANRSSIVAARSSHGFCASPASVACSTSRGPHPDVS
jgi:hypothetical protein